MECDYVIEVGKTQEMQSFVFNSDLGPVINSWGIC